VATVQLLTNIKKTFKNEVKMKFKIEECAQCGSKFKITNPKQVYCRPACRSAAHRDRHGYEQPIFKYDEIRD
jgi:hypothetical protein